MAADKIEFIQAIEQASQALRRSDRLSARHWAERAAVLDPASEEPWLILASVASPHASLNYYQRALEKNPASLVAAEGLRQAHERLDAGKQPVQPPAAFARPQRWLRLAGWMVAALVILALVGWAITVGGVSQALAMVFSAIPAPAERVQAAVPDPTQTSGSAALAPTQTERPLPTSTPPPMQRAASAEPTERPLLPLTGSGVEGSLVATSVPSQQVQSDATEMASVALTSAVAPTSAALPSAATPAGQKRILVSISEQRMHVFEGDQELYTFVVSTGMYDNTWVGNFTVLDKITDAYSAVGGFWMPDWMGIYYAGYDLENGIHALPVSPDGQEYWGESLGTPISYGCIVMSRANAETLFNWADVGTPVEIVK